MNANEKWNRIVELYNQYYNDQESQVQYLWENIFAEIFGYSKLDGEVERHRKIPLGSTERVITDIIIKEQQKDLFIVELKQFNLSFDNSMERQLFSYLKQLRQNVGILICRNIYLYYFDYSVEDSKQLKAEIAFKKDDADGIKLIELLSKGSFSKSKIEQFIRQKNNFGNNVNEIRKEISKNLIIDLIVKHFSATYTKEEVDAALQNFDVSVSSKNSNGNYELRTNGIITDSHRNVSNNPTKYSDSISPSDAKDRVKREGIDLTDCKCTFASLNKTGTVYWSNPNPNVLHRKWCLILNDYKHRVLYIFLVPANALTLSDVKIRNDNSLIDLQIKYDDESFEDTRSHITFAKWYTKTLSY